ASGLTVSITKTCFFTTGVHQAEIEQIEEECGLSRGMLPVRYLGVPLCTRKLAGSIWVAWFIQNVLSGDLSNLWTLREKQTHSSSTKNILRVRDYVYNWIKIVPGSGKNCRFWSDNWSPYGNLRQYFGLAPTTSLGIRASATLHDLFQQGRWLLPQPRSEAQLNLHIHLSTITLSEVNDEYT
ncbi:hypothetical protein HID58_088145, partial [Brassica napus]